MKTLNAGYKAQGMMLVQKGGRQEKSGSHLKLKKVLRKLTVFIRMCRKKKIAFKTKKI